MALKGGGGGFTLVLFVKPRIFEWRSCPGKRMPVQASVVSRLCVSTLMNLVKVGVTAGIYSVSVLGGRSCFDFPCP